LSRKPEIGRNQLLLLICTDAVRSAGLDCVERIQPLLFTDFNTIVALSALWAKYPFISVPACRFVAFDGVSQAQQGISPNISEETKARR
jgi:hypothetical protein